MESVVKDIFLLVGCEISRDPNSDIQVLDNSIYRDILLNGSLAIGEGYMNHKIEIRNFGKTFKKAISQ